MGIKKTAYAENVWADSSKARHLPKIITKPIEQINFLHGDTPGYISLFRKLPEGKEVTRHYTIKQIGAELHAWGGVDSYVGMNTFFTPRRLATNLKEIRTAYVDLDCYNVGYTPQEVADILTAEYFGHQIPPPSMMIYSGRGLNLVWRLEPLSGLAVERWERLQQAIAGKLERFGVDKGAQDASRVFRLADSTNSKNGACVYCEVLHEERYEFYNLVDRYFPEVRRRVQKPKKKRRRKSRERRGSIAHVFNTYTLGIARMKDVEALVALRGGAMPNCREYALFLYRYWQLEAHGDKEKALQAIHELNSTFADPLPLNEVVHDTKSAERYYEGDEPFTITNKKIIKWLRITPEEQRHLSTIIGSAEKRRRNRNAKEEKRRASGVVPQAEYNGRRQSEKADNVARLADLRGKYPKATQKELAAFMGVSLSTIKRYLRELNKKGS